MAVEVDDQKAFACKSLFKAGGTAASTHRSGGSRALASCYEKHYRGMVSAKVSWVGVALVRSSSIQLLRFFPSNRQLRGSGRAVIALELNFQAQHAPSGVKSCE